MSHADPVPIPVPAITLTSFDVARLDALMQSPALKRTAAVAALAEEIDRATIVPPQSIGKDVVTMNSTVRCVDELTGDHHHLTLVFPHESDVLSGKVSVLAPVGIALLGLSLGQRIDWPTPSGRQLRLRVEKISYQPEAAGDWHR